VRFLHSWADREYQRSHVDISRQYQRSLIESLMESISLHEIAISEISIRDLYQRSLRSLSEISDIVDLSTLSEISDIVDISTSHVDVSTISEIASLSKETIRRHRSLLQKNPIKETSGFSSREKRSLKFLRHLFRERVLGISEIASLMCEISVERQAISDIFDIYTCDL